MLPVFLSVSWPVLVAVVVPTAAGVGGMVRMFRDAKPVEPVEVRPQRFTTLADLAARARARKVAA